MLQDSLKKAVVPNLKSVLNSLLNKSENWASHGMLAHTHGQPASPTTLGK